MSPLIRALVVDDEIHARRGMCSLLDEEGDFEVIGEAANGTEAVPAIRRLHPDIVFLDVAMPEHSGLDVIEEIGVQAMPPVVFITAYDRYAIQAFEANAVDYLLKPFSDARFREALRRARERVRKLREDHLEDRLERLLDSRTPADGLLERFAVKVGERFRVFHADDIDWIEADEYYVKLHIGSSAYLVRQTLGSLERQLQPQRFARIHRSTIVNLDRVVALEPLFQGDMTVALSDGTRLRMSRRRRSLLSNLLKTLG